MRYAFVLSFAAVAVALTACRDANTTSDSRPSHWYVFVGPTQTAERWSDGEVVAYLRDLASLLESDTSAVKRKAHAAAIPTVLREIIAEHDTLRLLGNALDVRRVPPHVSGRVDHQRHRDAMKRATRRHVRDFDRRYVRILEQTLIEAEARLEQSLRKRRPSSVDEFITHALTRVRAQRARAGRAGMAGPPQSITGDRSDAAHAACCRQGT